jgi:hypothetical protein
MPATLAPARDAVKFLWNSAVIFLEGGDSATGCFRACFGSRAFFLSSSLNGVERVSVPFAIFPAVLADACGRICWVDSAGGSGAASLA